MLDASAVLALVHDEPGADEVAAALPDAALGAANLAEVIGKPVSYTHLTLPTTPYV